MDRIKALWMYSLDWFIIIAAIIIALLLANVNPDSHTFCLLDMSISHPHRENPKVPLWLLVALAIILPVASITFVSMYARPRPDHTNRWRTKVPELNASLLGLGVSLGTATIVYTGVKNLTGKPRPDFLSTCQPDLDAIVSHTVGGFGQGVFHLWVMVDRGICKQPDKMQLNDALRSFPSGYATISFAGLWYLSLWLCSKFDLNFAPVAFQRHPTNERAMNDEGEPFITESEGGSMRSESRRRALMAAPRVHLLFLPYIPLGLAIFVAGTRYFDFRNHGFDVLAGAVVGSLSAWVGFCWYRLGSC